MTSNYICTKVRRRMNSIKAIIIEDEQRGALSLQKMIERFHTDIEVIEIAENGKNGIAAIKRNQPDIIFLDIQMPDMTGFDMLEQLESINFDIIFTTAHDQYALRAFKHAAVDYLLKPIDMDELSDALAKLRARKRNNQPQDYLPIESLLQQIHKKDINRITLPTTDGLLFVNISDIIRLEADSNYTTFHITSRKPIIISRSLREFETQRSSYNFFRVHHGHIVNLLHIEQFSRTDGGIVIMSDKASIEVSRRKKDDFLQAIKRIIPI